MVYSVPFPYFKALKKLTFKQNILEEKLKQVTMDWASAIRQILLKYCNDITMQICITKQVCIYSAWYLGDLLIGAGPFCEK